MMQHCRFWYRWIKALKWLSPGSFVLCSLTFAATFLVLHVAGWREETRVLCGTLPEDRSAQTVRCFQAVSYTLIYLVTVIVSPALLLAAAIFQAMLLHGRPRPLKGGDSTV